MIKKLKTNQKKIITDAGYGIYVNDSFVYSNLLMWDFEIIELVKPSFFKKNGYAKIKIIRNEKIDKLEKLLNDLLAKYDKIMCFSCFEWFELDGANRKEKYNELKNRNELIITINLNKIYSNFKGEFKEGILFDYLVNSYSACWPLDLKGFIIDDRISSRIVPSNNKLVALGRIDNYYYNRNRFSKRENKVILWRILKIEDDRALLVSDDALLIDKYDYDGDEYLKSSIRDKLSSLQKILNIKEDYLLKNTKDGLNDYFFLLSKEEVMKFMKEEDFVANCTAFATPLDLENPLGPYDYHYRVGFEKFELESPSNWSIEKNDSTFATYIDKPVKWFLRDSENGLCVAINEKGEFETLKSTEELGIRPAVWIKLLDRFSEGEPREKKMKERLECDIKYETWKNKKY